MINRRVWLSLLSMAVGSWISTAVAQPPVISNAECQVAEAALKIWSPPDVPSIETVKFLDSEVGGFPPIDLGKYDLTARKSWSSEDAPSPELVQRFIQRPQTAALRACSALEAFARTKGWTTAKGVKAEIQKIWDIDYGNKDFGRRWGVVLVLLTPVISADGHEALIEGELVCGNLCGHGTLVYLKQDINGHWVATAFRELWAS